jgi:hypothetical protein
MSMREAAAGKLVSTAAMTAQSGNYSRLGAGPGLSAGGLNRTKADTQLSTPLTEGHPIHRLAPTRGQFNAAVRSFVGDCPNVCEKAREKCDAFSKPTSRAISIKDALVLTSSCFARSIRTRR